MRCSADCLNNVNRHKVFCYCLLVSCLLVCFKKEKKFFLFFTLTPSHLTLPAGSTLLAGDSMNGRQIQWTGRKKAVLYRQYSYGILLVQLCCTVGATMLHCWCNYAGTVGATMLALLV